jgi:hypothetical protein
VDLDLRTSYYSSRYVVAFPSYLNHASTPRYQASIANPLIHMKLKASTAPIAAARIHQSAAFLFMKPIIHFLAASILVIGFF